LRATIKDVSREAGVSIKTVSRVLNRERYVGAETRARVEAAMASLNFRPSLAARSLAGRRSFQVALVCDNPSPNYVFEMQAGVRDRCEADGVRMMAQPYDRRSGKLVEQIEALVDTTALDGLVLTPPVCDDAEVLAALAERGIRFARVSPGHVEAAAPSVFINNVRAAAEITAHLIALGHRRIAHIAGPPEFATSAQRLTGYRAALEAAGSFDPALVIQGRFDFASGAEAATSLLDSDAPPTAIFAASDEMAAGALATAHRRGIAVPGALSIAGFGDDALAGYVWPPLTTVRQPVHAFGWNAADLLLSNEADAPVEHRELAYDVITRDSTGPVSR
jgi:LacI family transcriptional regulator